MSNLIKNLQEGWEERNGIRRTTQINPGELSLLLKSEFKDRLKFNLLTLKPELDGIPLPNKFQDFFYIKLGEIGWRIGKDQARDSLIYASQQFCYDPVVQYLQDLEQQEKEGKLYQADINNVASDYLGIDDPLSNKMVKVWLVGSVARAFERGYKFDTMLVLHGSQRIGKSSFFRILMGNPDFFCDTPCHNHKDRLMLIQTTWCYEIAELENLTNKQTAGELKALMSSAYDTFRPPYGHNVVKSPRGSTLVGTANKETNLLNDPSGATRFHFIRLQNKTGEKINLEAIKEDRNSIWLSAIKSYREGFVPVLSQEETLLSEARNEDFQKENDFYTPIADWIRRTEPVNPFTTREALIGAGLMTSYDKPKFQESVQVGDALRSLGYTQKQMRINKTRDRYWTKEEKEETVPTVPSPGNDDVTPNTPANNNEVSSCPNVTTKKGKSSNKVETPHKAIAGLLSKANVTPKKEPEKPVTANSSTSQSKMSQEEQDKKFKELNEYWNSL